MQTSTYKQKMFDMQTQLPGNPLLIAARGNKSSIAGKKIRHRIRPDSLALLCRQVVCARCVGL
jgi:hypothetical protein